MNTLPWVKKIPEGIHVFLTRNRYGDTYEYQVYKLYDDGDGDKYYVNSCDNYVVGSIRADDYLIIEE